MSLYTGGGALHRPQRVNLEYEAAIDGVTRKVELPFVTGVMADLSGTPPKTAVADRTFLDIDWSNFDARIATIRPRLIFAVPNTLTGEGDLQVTLTFASLEDFSPTAVARRFRPLRALLEVRRQLAKLAANDDAVRPRLAEIDRRANEQLNLILHAPDFLRLEATWRGLHYLVNHTKTDEMLRIKVLDISKVALARTYARARFDDRNLLFKKIYSEEYGTRGAAPFGCLIGDYLFDHSASDVALLTEMARIGEAAHVPFLTGASPNVLRLYSWADLPGVRDLVKVFTALEYKAWRALRGSTDARHLGLTLPGFLARPPYRADAAPGEFAFEEDVRHDHFVWANSAYLMAVNIHRSFETHGWCSCIYGRTGGAVQGLAMVRQADGVGAPTTVGPTEIAIDDRRQGELARAGFLVLVHRIDSDTAAFLKAPSLGQPAESTDADAHLYVQLPWVFASGRIAHHIKSIVRERFADTTDRRKVQHWLEDWIANYVDSKSTTSETLTQSPRPLAAATIVVEQVEQASADSNAWRTKFSVRLNPDFNCSDP